MNRLPSLAALLVLGVLATGCGTKGDVAGSPGGEPTTLDATYVVTGVTRGGKPYDLVKGTEVRLAFDVDSLTLTAGCNTISGLYSYDGTTLTVDQLGGTDMGCDRARMDQDTWLTGLFEEPVDLATGSDPALTSGDVVLSLTDLKTLHPDPPLVGTSWVLDGIGSMDGDNGSVASVPKGVVAYVVLDGSTVDVYDGCNGGGGKATVEGDTITFGDLASTLRGCTGPFVQEVQQAFAAVLQGEATYSIDGQTMMLVRGDRSLYFRAAEKLPAHD